MNSTQPLNVKNAGQTFGEFMKGQTRKGKPLSYTELKEKYAPKLLEYANGLTQEASKLEKVKKIRDRLAQLDFEEIQRRQREQSDDHNIAIEQSEELLELQKRQEELNKEWQENSTRISAKLEEHDRHQREMQASHSEVMLVTEQNKQSQASGSQEVNNAMQACFAAHEKDKQNLVKGCRDLANASEAKQKKDQENCINYVTNWANKELEEKDKQIQQEHKKTSHDASCKKEGRHT